MDTLFTEDIRAQKRHTISIKLTSANYTRVHALFNLCRVLRYASDIDIKICDTRPLHGAYLGYKPFLLQKYRRGARGYVSSRLRNEVFNIQGHEKGAEIQIGRKQIGRHGIHREHSQFWIHMLPVISVSREQSAQSIIPAIQSRVYCTLPTVQRGPSPECGIFSKRAVAPTTHLSIARWALEQMNQENSVIPSVEGINHEVKKTESHDWEERERDEVKKREAEVNKPRTKQTTQQDTSSETSNPQPKSSSKRALRPIAPKGKLSPQSKSSLPSKTQKATPKSTRQSTRQTKPPKRMAEQLERPTPSKIARNIRPKPQAKEGDLHETRVETSSPNIVRGPMEGSSALTETEYDAVLGLMKMLAEKRKEEERKERSATIESYE